MSENQLDNTHKEEVMESTAKEEKLLYESSVQGVTLAGTTIKNENNNVISDNGFTNNNCSNSNENKEWAVTTTAHPNLSILDRRDTTRHSLLSLSPVERRVIVGTCRTGIAIGEGILLHGQTLINPILSAALVLYSTSQVVRSYYNGTPNRLGYRTSMMDVGMHVGKELLLTAAGIGIGQVVGAVIGLSALPLAGQIIAGTVLSVGIGIGVGTLLTRYVDRLFVRWQIRRQYHYPSDEKGARRKFEELLQSRHDLATLETCTIVQHYADYRVACGWESANDVDDYRASRDVRRMPVSFQHFAIVQLQRKWGFLNDHAGCKKVYKALMLLHHPDRKGGDANLAAQLNSDYEIYAFCQGWEEDCPTLLSSGRVEADQYEEQEEYEEENEKKRGNWCKTAKGKFTLPHRHAVVDFLRSLFRPASNSVHDANDLHQFGLLTLEAGPRAAMAFNRNNSNTYFTNMSTSITHNNITTGSNSNNNNINSNTVNNCSISLDSFSDIDLDDDVVRYLRQVSRHQGNRSFSSLSSSLASSFAMANNNNSSNIAASTTINNNNNNNNNNYNNNNNNAYISGLVLQRGVSKVLSAVEQSYRNSVEAVTFSELLLLMENNVVWDRLCEEVYLFNRLQCYLTVTQFNKDNMIDENSDGKNKDCVLSSTPLQVNQQELKNAVKEFDITAEGNNESLIEKEDKEEEEEEEELHKEELSRKQFHNFTWHTTEEAIQERERLRVEIISTVFTEEINNKLLLAADLWSAAQKMAENYYKECANDITTRAEDGATQIIDTLLSIRHKLTHLAESHEPPSHSFFEKKKEEDGKVTNIANDNEDNTVTSNNNNNNNINVKDDKVESEHGEALWWHLDKHTRVCKMLQLKLVALTASSALAAEHARQIQIHAEDVCSSYFAAWARKQETISMLESELREAELLTEATEQHETNKSQQATRSESAASELPITNDSIDEIRATQLSWCEGDETISSNTEGNATKSNNNNNNNNNKDDKLEKEITMVEVINCPTQQHSYNYCNSNINSNNNNKSNHNNNNSVQSRIEDFVTQLILTQQQLAEIDSLVLELYNLCWLHFPENLTWLDRLPSSIARRAEANAQMPRLTTHERERLLRSYVHVQEEPNIYIAPVERPGTAATSTSINKADTIISNNNNNSSSSSNKNYEQTKWKSEEKQVSLREQWQEEEQETLELEEVCANSKKSEELHITITYELLRAVYVDPLTNAFATCWLKHYTFISTPTITPHQANGNCDTKGSNNVALPQTKLEQKEEECITRQNLQNKMYYLALSEMRLSEHCNSPFITSGSELFASANPLSLYVHIPRAATQERFSSVHDVARRITPLGLQWLHNALTCVIELHGCFLVHGSISLHHFTYDEFGNTTLGFFNEIPFSNMRWMKWQRQRRIFANREERYYNENENEHTDNKEHASRSLAENVMMSCSEVTSEKKFEEYVRKDTVDFGIMLLSEILPYWTFSEKGNSNAEVHLDNSCDDSNNSNHNINKHCNKGNDKKMTMQDHLQLIQAIGEHLIGKEHPRWTLLDARFCVRRYLQFNFDDCDQSFFVNTQFTFPASWAVRHSLMNMQISPVHNTCLHIDNGESRNCEVVNMYLNKNVALWEMYWRSRRRAMHYRTHICTLPSMLKNKVPLLFCADDWEVNERFMWYPCANEELAWQIAQTGFDDKITQMSNETNKERKLVNSNEICILPDLQYMRQESLEYNEINLVKNVKQEQLQWGIVCRVILGNAAFVDDKSEEAKKIEQITNIKTQNGSECHHITVNKNKFYCKIKEIARQSDTRDSSIEVTIPHPLTRCYPEYIISMQF